MNCDAYVLRAAYPAVQPGKNNPALTRRLFAAYAGQSSETTTIFQYIYSGLLTNASGQRAISELFSCISRVEMHHMRLLGELILAYGGDPGWLSFRGERKIWWSGEFVHHVKASERMLQEALEGERAAVREYQSLLRLVPDQGNQAVIERVLADEQHHVGLFEAAVKREGPKG